MKISKFSLYHEHLYTNFFRHRKEIKKNLEQAMTSEIVEATNTDDRYTLNETLHLSYCFLSFKPHLDMIKKETLDSQGTEEITKSNGSKALRATLKIKKMYQFIDYWMNID